MNTLTLKARLADRDRQKFFVTFLGGKLLGLGLAFYAIVSLGPRIVGTVAHAASVPRADDIQTQVTGVVNGLNTAWVLIAAFLVFFMQAGYVVQRVRRRIADLNICITTARGRGFVIYIDGQNGAT